MLLAIIALIVLVVAVILAIAATKPDSIRVVRSATIDAPPQKIFPLIDDFHMWSQWSPWERLDPAMSRTHSGSPSGKGAAYAWEGNKQGGGGGMEITDSTPPSRLAMKLDFQRPFEAHNTTEFTLAPAGGSTNVTWAMDGKNAFMMKVAGLFMNMDKAIGKDFERGLANMKEVAE